MGSANYLGRSEFSGPPNNDPYFNGQMDSVQIYADAMPAEQLMAIPINASRQGANFALNWPALSPGLVLQSASTMGPPANWTPVVGNPTTTNGIQFLSLPIAGPGQLFRFQWPAVAN